MRPDRRNYLVEQLVAPYRLRTEPSVSVALGRPVQEDPLGLVQQRAGQREPLLLLRGQDPVPRLEFVEPRVEMPQPEELTSRERASRRRAFLASARWFVDRARPECQILGPRRARRGTAGGGG